MIFGSIKVELTNPIHFIFLILIYWIFNIGIYNCFYIVFLFVKLNLFLLVCYIIIFLDRLIIYVNELIKDCRGFIIDNKKGILNIKSFNRHECTDIDIVTTNNSESHHVHESWINWSLALGKINSYGLKKFYPTLSLRLL